jgi:hypothetical protein
MEFYAAGKIREGEGLCGRLSVDDGPGRCRIDDWRAANGRMEGRKAKRWNVGMRKRLNVGTSGGGRLGHALADFLSPNFAWLGKFEDIRARNAKQIRRLVDGEDLI